MNKSEEIAFWGVAVLVIAFCFWLGKLVNDLPDHIFDVSLTFDSFEKGN